MEGLLWSLKTLDPLLLATPPPQQAGRQLQS
jgi:hypothetical protein